MEKESLEGNNIKVNNLNSNEGVPSQVEKAIEFDVKKLLEEIQSEQQNPMTSNVQLKRLMSTNFISPYEVLMLNTEATDEEIKKQYRQMSLLVHPDKCNDDKAPDAFHVLETAYKTLQDPEKKKFFQRVIREARERVEIERSKEDKLRMKKGQPPLPKETFNTDLKTMTKKIIEEIDERKTHTEKMETAHKKRERDEEEFRRMQEDLEKQQAKEWESFRDKRVKNWNKFQSKILNGKRKGKYEIKPPRYKMEERTDNDKVDVFRPNTII